MITLPTRLDLIKLLPNGSKVVEVGSYRGEFAHAMLELPNIGKLYLVDPYRHIENYRDPLPNKDYEDNYRAMMDAIKGHLAGGRVEVIRKTSIEASIGFQNDFLDAIFLDADHSYKSVIADLLAWNRVIKPDGVICGHDFFDNHPTAVKHGWGVEKAVAEFCASCGWIQTHITSEEFASFALKRV